MAASGCDASIGCLLLFNRIFYGLILLNPLAFRAYSPLITTDIELEKADH
jgi:hypothetical protein